MKHRVPSEWIAEAGLHGFVPVTLGFHCEVPHVLMPLADIEPPMRNEGVTLDANGFGRERMMRILHGILASDRLPPIDVETADPPQRPYRLRSGFHRFYASCACGFSHIPVDIVPRIY
jgi:hypothetical protein